MRQTVKETTQTKRKGGQPCAHVKRREHTGIQQAVTPVKAAIDRARATQPETPHLQLQAALPARQNRKAIQIVFTASTFDPTFSHQEYGQDEATLGVRNWLPCVTHDHRRRLRSTQLSPTKNTNKMRRHWVFGTGCHASHTTAGGVYVRPNFLPPRIRTR
ncbi:hypothetical protein J6590_039948 [Homalodisca vitripennis]|nr:hypothetical protein J6590_039948 [Homalodisca vitripennis]